MPALPGSDPCCRQRIRDRLRRLLDPLATKTLGDLIGAVAINHREVRQIVACGKYMRQVEQGVV